MIENVWWEHVRLQIIDSLLWWASYVLEFSVDGTQMQSSLIKSKNRVNAFSAIPLSKLWNSCSFDFNSNWCTSEVINLEHRCRAKHDSSQSFTHNKTVSLLSLDFQQPKSALDIGSYLVTDYLPTSLGSCPKQKKKERNSDTCCIRDPERKRALNQGRISHTATASLRSAHK